MMLYLTVIAVTVVSLVAIIIWGAGAGATGAALHRLSAYLAAAVRRNFPLGQALRVYSTELPRTDGLKRRNVLNDVADLVEGGRPFSEALGAHPEVFPAHYRALVRAGERGGNLASVLGRLSEAAEAESLMGGVSVRSAIYPLWVSAIVLAQLVMIGVVVAPKFKVMMEEIGFSRDMYPLGLRLSSYLPVIAVALLVILLAMVAVCLPFPTVRGRVGRLLAPLAPFASWLRWHMPLVSRYERRRAISRYALAAGTLVEAGVPTHEALRISATASGTTHFDRIALAAAEEVAEGSPISDAMRAADTRHELPEDFLWYIEVGESSEDLAGAFSRAAETSAVRSRSALGGLVKLVAPASILLLGFFVGALCYGVFEMFHRIMQGLGI